MTRFRFPLIAVSFLALAACKPAVPADTPTPPAAASSSSAESSAPAMAMAEGKLAKVGIGIYMQGTHRLMTDLGQELLLQSSTLQLDDYVDLQVRVSGEVSPAVENGAMIMTVQTIERVESSSSVMSSSEMSVSSTSSVASSSSSLTSSSSSISSLAAMQASSVASSVRRSSSVASSAPAVSSRSSVSSAALSAVDASVTAMAKAKVDATNFTQKYCSSHIGFCIPVHRNWFYKSFGAASSSLWQVEISDHETENAGEGVIFVRLVSGALQGAEGVAVETEAGKVVASRQWTGNRHFEISGPAELKSAIEFIAAGLAVSEPQ